MTTADHKPDAATHVAFAGERRLAEGDLIAAALAAQAAQVAQVAPGTASEAADGPVLIFDNSTGAVVDLDLRGTPAELSARLAPDLASSPAPGEPRGPGRPKLGVVAREVTLLPRHWDWLAGQPGGASVALRKLVEEVMRQSAGADRARKAQEALYRVILVLAGNRPGFEAASRALFARDRVAFALAIRDWPADVRAQAERMAEPAFPT